jgi:hypothetical protein
MRATAFPATNDKLGNFTPVGSIGLCLKQTKVGYQVLLFYIDPVLEPGRARRA